MLSDRVNYELTVFRNSININSARESAHESSIQMGLNILFCALDELRDNHRMVTRHFRGSLELLFQL